MSPRRLKSGRVIFISILESICFRSSNPESLSVVFSFAVFSRNPFKLHMNKGGAQSANFGGSVEPSKLSVLTEVTVLDRNRREGGLQHMV